MKRWPRNLLPCFGEIEFVHFGTGFGLTLSFTCFFGIGLFDIHLILQLAIYCHVLYVQSQNFHAPRLRRIQPPIFPTHEAIY